ncbi:TPA: CatB-related O-acetyltransferase [Providencia stuartii]
MKKIIKKLISKYWIFKYRLNSKNLLIDYSVELDSKCSFEGFNYIYTGSTLRNVSVGRGSYIGPECYLLDVSIGRFCSIAHDVKVIIGAHPSSTFVSSHPAFYSIRKQAGFTFVKENLFEERKYITSTNKKSILIGNDVWIGTGVRILEGVKIGDGAIIGANSLVTKDIAPFSISVGIPARHLKYRFNEIQIKNLRKSKWWDQDIEYIRKNIFIFTNIERFLREYKK